MPRHPTWDHQGFAPLYCTCIPPVNTQKHTPYHTLTLTPTHTHTLHVQNKKANTNTMDDYSGHLNVTVHRCNGLEISLQAKYVVKIV